MILKIYQKHIIGSFLKILLLMSFIFLCLAFFLNILEEIRFFQNFNLNIYYPIFLTLLNIPSIIFEIFPFIFLLSTQLFFINLYNKEELIIYKNYGLNNLNIIKILIITSLICGFFICTVFYFFSSNMKHSYLSFKNKFTEDNKYLAVINENGLWIKDEINDSINIINAELFENRLLKNITISQLDENFDLSQTIIADKANIDKSEWKLENVKIFKVRGENKKFDEMLFESNFNSKKINNLFSNLSSLNYFQLVTLFDDYKLLGYSTFEIQSYLNRLYSFPIYLTMMTLIGAILMFNVKYNKSKIFNIIIGILISVFIYYINYFSYLLGINERLPIVISIWLPLIILFLTCFIGMVKINEK